MELRLKGSDRGVDMLLDEASVTGTANIVMAAVLAKEKQRCIMLFVEPYLQQLCKNAKLHGAKITGLAQIY
jgi:UDP-N-acetylglucosamine 1-carboxyvinyltransferase